MTPEHFRQVEELYYAACEDRAVLANADPDLRLEVEALLAHGEASLPTLTFGSLSKADLPIAPTAVAPGTRLGPYLIEAPLGAGGMGVVFRARDKRLGRSVAIKLIRAEHTQRDDFQIRFQREARATAALNHPNICTLYDVGQLDGAAYLVMEYVEGRTLASRLQEGPMPFDQLIRLGMEIARALAAAHERGIIHRDLKPANLMLTSTGIKVLDFGLAKFAGARGRVRFARRAPLRHTRSWVRRPICRPSKLGAKN